MTKAAPRKSKVASKKVSAIKKKVEIQVTAAR